MAVTIKSGIYHCSTTWEAKKAVAAVYPKACSRLDDGRLDEVREFFPKGEPERRFAEYHRKAKRLEIYHELIPKK